LGEVFLILGYEAASLADLGPTFRNSVEVSTSRAENSATLENETTLSRNAGHQSSSQAAPYLRRTETSTAPLRKPKKLRMLVWFEGNIWYSGLWTVGFPILYLCDFHYIKFFDTVI